MKKVKYKYLDPNRPIKPTLNAVVQDIYNYISVLISHLDREIDLTDEGKFIMNGKELPHFSDSSIDEMIIEYLANPEGVNFLQEDKRIAETFPQLMNEIHSIKMGVLIGIFADRFKYTGNAEHVIREQAQENFFKSILEQLSTLNSAKEEINKQIEASKITSEQLSNVAKYRIKVSTYLKKEYPKISITPNNLYYLPKEIKEEGRHFLRAKLGVGPQTINNIKDVFHKPRKDKRRDDDELYKVGPINK
jgi:hypothetical protein